MVWCKNCGRSVAGNRPDDSDLCCELCGRVLATDNFSHEPTFGKNSAGQSRLSGNFVTSILNDGSLSRGRTLSRVKDEMSYMWHGLTEDQNTDVVDAAARFYGMALDRNFTRGRKTEQVQAACLYISCRVKNKPYLLIDFSHYLQINVYVLGAVFLQLCKVLWLGENDIVRKPVDPSLFMYKFTASLLGKKNRKVAEVAIRIITRMKRDWMQTGRKPSGICGAALYIAAKGEGIKCSKSDITRIVHICDATLTKRLVEFESTDSASLTIEELNNEAKEYTGAQKSDLGLKGSGKQELLCVHKGDDIPPPCFSLGLCQVCFDEFTEVSGGLEGGADPPAFQRAERERKGKALATEDPHQSHPEKETDTMDVNKGDYDNPHGDDINTDSDESETLSDIDDLEVGTYLLTEKEKAYKKEIWENMNREYLEEQAAKEAAAAAAEADCVGRSEEVKELASVVAAAKAKSSKERREKRAAEAKSVGPAQTAAEATQRMLAKKRLFSKIDMDKLDRLFNEPVCSVF